MIGKSLYATKEAEDVVVTVQYGQSVVVPFERGAYRHLLSQASMLQPM